MSAADVFLNSPPMFVRLWQFRASPGRETEFESAYGPEGAWARLFRRSSGYLGTELFRSAGNGGVYLTVDRWASAEAWSSFQHAHSAEYDTLDRECAHLCVLETSLGEYVSVDTEDSSL